MSTKSNIKEKLQLKGNPCQREFQSVGDYSQKELQLEEVQLKERLYQMKDLIRGSQVKGRT